MNYIGFYLCYLLQTAKLINVLSSVLTQLFRKVKEVQRNFPRAAPGTLSAGRGGGSPPDGDATHGVAGNELTRLSCLGPGRLRPTWVQQKSARLELSAVFPGHNGLPDTVLRPAPHLLGVATKVWTCPLPNPPAPPTPLLLRFIPADCSFSNANGVGQGLGFLPCQLATGAVGRI